MKRIVLIAALAFVLPGMQAARAQQEQYIYTPGMPSSPTMYDSRITTPRQRAVARQQVQQYTRYPYGNFYGRPTPWPGAYRDVVDRGQWPAGGADVAPIRAYNDYRR